MKLTDYRTAYFKVYGGWVIQVKSDKANYWYTPMAEMNYGVLDTEWPNIYSTQANAAKALNKFINSQMASQ